MTTVQLGAGLPEQRTPAQVDYGPLAGLVQSMRADITAAVLAGLQDSVISTLAARLQNLHVNVPTPVIQVDSPIHMEPAEPAEVVVPGMEEMAAQLSALNTGVATLISLLSMPVTRVVQRDNGVIVKMVESR